MNKAFVSIYFPLQEEVHMSKFPWLFRLLIGGLCLIAPDAVSQTAPPESHPKLALVIGNKDYRHSPLQNTLNDARDMAAKLRALGFSVSLKENLPDEKAMKRALLETTQQIQPGGVFRHIYRLCYRSG